MRYRQHIKETVWLSLPLVVSQVGHIITSMTDNAFLGFVSLESQDAGILSSSVFVLPLVFLIGMSQGLTPKIAEAHVNGREKVKASLFKNSFLLNLVSAIILYTITMSCLGVLPYLNQPADVVELASPFLNIISLSLIPLALFFTLKQYCEGLSNTRAAMYISLSGNALNVVLNYGFIFGKLGFPEMGYLGAAWATFISRWFMAIAFFIYVKKHKHISAVFLNLSQTRFSKSEQRILFGIGIGPAVQYIFEVAAFVFAGFMCGWLGKVTYAAHGIALGIASFTYMFASGISGAASIRVANFKGLNDKANIRRSGYAGFGLSAAVMLFFGILFLFCNHFFTSFFSDKPEVLALSAGLLLVAALFQMFDGVQCVGLGILRGLSDVKIPTLVALCAYWLLALPIAYYLGFVLNYGVYGVWFGLTAGLVFSAVATVSRFRHLAR